MKIKDKEEALELLAFTKGYLNTTADEAGKNPEEIKMYLSFIDAVQLFIDPEADLNGIQEKVNGL